MPIGPAWSYEVKWDGYRCLALKASDDVTLRSRNASIHGRRNPRLMAAILRDRL
jgi:ATP-dependent DNA ligase